MLLEYLKRKARIIILSDKKLRVATIFSGIGAPEWALKRLGVPHELVFACDNGEIEYTEDDETIKQHLVTLTSKEAEIFRFIVAEKS